MPFTLAHPAAVVPFVGRNTRYIDATALVLGTMAPDFEYFLRFKAYGVIGHTFTGFLYFNLPLVFIAATLWHFAIKKPFILSLPKRFGIVFINNYEEKWRPNNIFSLLVFIISALIGMGTHVLWDSFSHANAFFVTRIPILSKYVSIMGNRVGVYKIVQYGSALVGFVIILSYIYYKSKNKKLDLPEQPKRRKIIYWLSIFEIALVILIIRAVLTLPTIKLSYYYFGIYVVTFISGTIIGIIFTSAFLRPAK